MTTLDNEYGRGRLWIYCMKPGIGQVVWGARLCDLSSKNMDWLHVIVDTNGQEHRYFYSDEGGFRDKNFTLTKCFDMPYDEYVTNVGMVMENGEVVPVIDERVIDRVAIHNARQQLARKEKEHEAREQAFRWSEESIMKDREQLAAFKEWLVTKELAMLSTQ